MPDYDDRLRPPDRNAPPYDRTRDATYDPTRDTSYDASRTTATYVERPRDVNDMRDDSPRHHQTKAGHKNVLDWLALVLLIVGGLNWGLVGLFGIDLVASILGPGSMLSRAVYIAVGLAGVWGFALTRLGPTKHV
jgi:uncharacterized membrane protein YuzA (DUF378 family)